MAKKLLLVILLCVSVVSVKAQPTARAQFLNNCPDIAFNAIDIYIDGVLTYDDLQFRNATAFANVPATIMFSVGIAPQNSTSASDIFHSMNMILQPHDTVMAIVNGLYTTTGYSPFIPLRIDTLMGAREAAYDPQNVDIMIAHGSTDAPVVDFRTGIETFVDNISFGGVKGYMEVPFGNHRFRITNQTGSKVIETYGLPLTTMTLPGTAGVIITSGFINPAANNNGPAFRTMFVPAAGGQFINLASADPEAYARVQVIHNSADKSIDTVDVYFDSDKVFDNVPFRTATPFFDASVSAPINVGFAPKSSTSVSDVFHSQSLQFDSAQKHIVVADGIESTTGYTPVIPFAIRSFNNSREEATTSTNTDILLIHGSTDMPTFDLREGTNLLADAVSYGSFVPYFSLSASANYVFTITNDANTMEIEKYKAELSSSSLSGQAITLLLSGFENTAGNSNGAEYGLYYAKATGGPLVPLAISTSVKDINKSSFTMWPNPAYHKLYIQGSKSLIHASVYDAAGRKVVEYTNPANELDVSTLTNGAYFIRLESQDGSFNYQFIKQ